MTIDRLEQQITNFTPPQTYRPPVVAPERDSIFGNTYNGVPNPMVPYQHPYPTRFHGPVFRYPQPGWQYERSPYARAPFDGLGEPLLGQWSSATGTDILDGVIGAGLGYLAAPSLDEGITHALVGGAAGLFLGYPGMIAFLLGETIMAHRASGRREDISQVASEAKAGVKRLVKR